MAWTGDRWFAWGCLCALLLALFPAASPAQEFALSLQPSVGVVGARPQRPQLPSITSLKALLGVGPFFDVSFGVGIVGLPNLSESSSSMSGMASTVGAGLRLKRPHDQRSASGASPWVDVEVLSVQGGAGDGPALAVGSGVSFPVGAARRVWMGPFVRYVQLMGENGAGGDRRAASGLFAGVTFEMLFVPPTSSERGDGGRR